MATDFIAIPDWFPWQNQGAGCALADLNGDGQLELIVLQVDNPTGANQAYYRVGWAVDSTGQVSAGWSPWIAIPDWFSWDNQGADISVADLNGDGQPELIVLQIDSPEGANQGYYRVGWSLDGAGQVTGGWSPWIAVPDWFAWENQGAGIAIADLDGNGRPELVVFQVDSPAGLNAGHYRVGWNLDAGGQVTGGWSEWMRADWFSWENQGAGIAIADLDGNGRPELVVFQIDNPANANQASYQIGWNLDRQGRVTGGWSPWVVVSGWFSCENQGAAIALADFNGDGRPELLNVFIDHPPAGNQGFYRVLDLEIDLDRAADFGTCRLLPENSQVLAVHAALLHTDRVCFFAGSSNNPANAGSEFRGIVWNFGDHSFTRSQVPADVFCSGHAFLADGRLLVAGGTLEYDFGHPFFGLREALAFDADAEQWTAVPSMAGGRWYPTLITLGDGRVLAISGLGEDGLLNLVPEIFSAATGWTALPALTAWSAVPDSSTRRVPLYAHLFLLRDGRVFYSGGQYGGNEGLNPCLLDLVASSMTEVPGLIGHEAQSHRNQAASVLLPPAQDQRVMLIGGGAADAAAHATTEAINNVNVIDLAANQPQYRDTAPLQYARMNHNAVLLPDRTVLVAGGSRMDESRVAATLVAEIYDPARETWASAAAARVPRLYHSVAVLLPDGTVITAGSNPARGDEELRLELFHPPYLFRGPRPVIDSVAQTFVYGETIDIQCREAADIRWVSLIRPTSTTHCLNSDQRLVDVPFSLGAGDRLAATIPNEPNLAPPGWYMLFLTNRTGIPSVASWVRLIAADALATVADSTG